MSTWRHKEQDKWTAYLIRSSCSFRSRYRQTSTKGSSSRTAHTNSRKNSASIKNQYSRILVQLSKTRSKRRNSRRSWRICRKWVKRRRTKTRWIKYKLNWSKCETLNQQGHPKEVAKMHKMMMKKDQTTRRVWTQQKRWACLTWRCRRWRK